MNQKKKKLIPIQHCYIAAHSVNEFEECKTDQILSRGQNWLNKGGESIGTTAFVCSELSVRYSSLIKLQQNHHQHHLHQQ
jgi:hypothetical protein